MKKEWILLGLIVLVAAFLRLWQLGQIPISPDWDEVSLGYNAYSILHSGADEYGKFLPIVLRSFDDYKPALYSYLAIPSIVTFGLNVFATRLPSAIFGIVSVIATYFLVKELFARKDLALLSSFLLAISPWHIQFSRVAFESNIGLTFNILSILFFLIGLKKNIFLTLSAIFAALSLYTYQAEKVFVPILAAILILIYRKKIMSISKKYLLSALILGFIISLPIFTYTITNKEALSRARGASILSSPIQSSDLDLARRNLLDRSNNDYFGLVVDNRRVIYFKEIIGNYFSHYDLNWLFVKGEAINKTYTNLRHQAFGMGNLYLFDLPFLLIGIYILLFSDFKKTTKLLIFSWFLTVPIPASITWDVPNSVRTLNFLPTFQIFIALGILQIYYLVEKQKYKFIALSLIGFLAIFNFVYYLDQYFVQYNYFASSYWQYGYEKLIPQIQKIEKNYDRVIISSQVPLDQSYIFFLFYLKYPPSEYQKISSQFSGEYRSSHKIGKYEFEGTKIKDERENENILIVGGVRDFLTTNRRILKTIYFPDGSPAILIVDKRI